MADPNTTNAVNDEQDKVELVTANCNLLWSQAQEFAYKRLSDKTDENAYELIGLYEARAKRIAATYARFYLETEDGGDPDKIGRYYWMALGAFASKTVACLLDKWQLKTSYAVYIKSIANGLGKGNLWLFMDISAPHWFYNHYPDNFETGMNCAAKRSGNSLEPPVKEVVDTMPWSSESLPLINNMALSDDLRKGFDLIPQIENESNPTKRRKLQMKHLMAIADHEQGVVLQPLIYEDPAFAKWAGVQRWPGMRYLAPKYELTFAHTCEVDDIELKSEAPDDMIIEGFDSRMQWIEQAAGIFHGLMEEKEQYMLQELSTIAGWVNTPDAQNVY